MVRIDQRDAHWSRRRPVRTIEPAEPIATGPRFPRFTAAIAAARAAHAPWLMALDEPAPYDEPAPRDEPAPYDGPAAYDEPAPYDGPAAYDEPTPYDDAAADDVRPGFDRVAAAPRAVYPHAADPPKSTVARWLGIGSCVALVAIVAATMLKQPIGAEVERLIRPWLAWQHDHEVAAPATDPVLPPERAAAPKPAPSGSVVAREELGPPGQPAMATPDGSALVPAPDDRWTPSVPIPSLKPPAAVR
jgi:hypothetical protein